MFLGHYAIGLAFKPLARRVSLGTLFLAAVWLDLIWPIFVLLGREEVRIEPGNTVVTPLEFVHYPLSHSLFSALVWGGLLGLGAFMLRRSKAAAIAVWAGVVSHWVLDWIAHRPDLPLFLDGEVKVGLGLWNSLEWTLAVEGALFGMGAVLYLFSTHARDWIGHAALWSLLVVLLGLWAANLFGPAPPSAEAVAWAGNLQWLLVLWGYWVDGHRRPTGLVVHKVQRAFR